MAYDIPSISDLEAIQLLNKHYAEVITSKKDGIASGLDITRTTNPITGVTRRTLYKILDDMDDTFLERLLKMAFTPVGTFTSGATLTDARQTLLWKVSQGGDGHYYSWSGTFPKAVTAGSSPSPIAAGSWVDRTDDSLRNEIRETVFQNMKRSYAEVGFNLVDGSFQLGGELSGYSDVLWDWASGKGYQWHLDEAKTVTAGSYPTNIGTDWIDKSGKTLRAIYENEEVRQKSNIRYYTNGDVLTQQNLDDCVAFCTASGVKMIMSGDFTAAESLEWGCDTDASTATIYTDHNIIFGTSTSGAVLENLNAFLPSVEPITIQSTVNTYKSGAALTIENIIHSRVVVKKIGEESGGWEIGLALLGDAAGCSWNDIVFMYGKNNRINTKCSRINSGFTNQNKIYLGRMYKKPYAVGSETDTSSYHIYCESVDSNTFICPAIEQDTLSGRPGAKTLAYFKNCSDNQLLRAHTESPNGSNIIFDGSSCQNNYVECEGASSGYNITISEINGALYNHCQKGRWGDARTMHFPITLNHGFDLDRPVLEVFDHSHSPHNRNGTSNYTDWTYRLFAARTQYKNYHDDYPRVDISGRAGYIYIGDGSFPPVRQYPVYMQTVSMFGNDTYIAPTSPITTRVDTGYTNVVIDFTCFSSDGAVYGTGVVRAAIYYSGTGDHVVLAQSCHVDSTNLDAGTLIVRLNSFSGMADILQVRAKAKYTTNQAINLTVKCSIRRSL